MHFYIKMSMEFNVMIAEVYVEVPVQQTNRPFDYVVPEKWSDVISVGMRVVVPFGPRKLLGFVTALKDTTEHTKLKTIHELLDIQPVLNEELLELGKHLAEETVCTTISAFQVMLPAALKGKYEKFVKIVESVELADCPKFLREIFVKQSRITFNDAIEKIGAVVLKQAISDGFLEVEIQAASKGKVKQERCIRVQLANSEIVQMLENQRSTATNAIALLEYFIANKEVISVSDFCDETGVSRQVVKKFIDNGVLEELKIEKYRNPHEVNQFKKTTPLQLTEVQSTALKPIVNAIDERRNENFLVYGVTGSGKTEVYLQAIQRALDHNKEAIMLVPEISLTPMMVSRFVGRFGDKVAVMHSGLSSGEKYDEWRKILRGEVSVVVGARSAVFAPFKNLGIIIIDEEHESSYKQDETPRYHARDVAIWRGTKNNCPVILGSATPSLESFARGRKGVYTLLTLSERVNNRPLPNVEIVDMRSELRDGNHSVFSRKLVEKMVERLERKEQVVLLLNRRGHSSFVMCRDCGYVVTCKHCDVSLTYHKTTNAMKCHYCGYEERVPVTCPECKSDHIRFFGIGTQKIEDELGRLFPTARVLRMDVDTTRRKGAHEELLKQFENEEAEILLGTQMIAKGLDFPKVTLVGVLSADTGLHISDFRAAEKTFQLLTQVAGRAGRHELLGEVVVQTYTPEHYCIELASNHDYDAFYQREMAVRRQTGYVPYYYITQILATHKDLLTLIDATNKIVNFLRRGLSSGAYIYGPTPMAISRVNDRYRYQILIKYRNEPNLDRDLHKINDYFALEKTKDSVYVSIDKNPNLM